jgi:feruloyl esterase
MFIQHRVKNLAVFFLATATSLLTFSQVPASGSSSARPLNLPVIAPVIDCAALASIDISAAVGAPTHIAAASVVNAKPAPYCKIEGYVEPAIKFEVHLPVSKWTQRLVQTGCGGLCGNLNIRLDHDGGCQVAQNGELAITSTDMGHSNNGTEEGSFGDDYQLRIDFAYRGVHMTTLVAKALIAKYYGQAPKFSYFMGCSDGGREALMEAQRYPEDFNGITAGAPAMNFTTQNTLYHGWNALTNIGTDGNPILTAVQLPVLHKAIVAQCDALDGLKDGLISDPLACHPNPAAVECKSGQDPSTCLTPAQVHVAEEIYKGAHDAQGGKLVLSGPLPGSELAWGGVCVPFPGQKDTMSLGVATGTLKHLAYEKNPPASYKLADLRFDRATFDAATKLHAIYDATDPDLSPYEKQGGKLILWHGLADPHISPLNTIAYYTAMQKIMGAGAVDKFARLYLFPGGYHCGGGEGPFSMDLLTPIMLWVERGIAPGAIVAAHVPENRMMLGPPPNGVPGAEAGPLAGGPGGPGGPPMGLPGGARGLPMMQGPPPGMAAVTPAKPDRTRPIYPYPFTAQYTGKGSIDDAANFVQGPARPAPAAALDWFGSSFYSAGYEKWCTGNGAVFNCKNSH